MTSTIAPCFLIVIEGLDGVGKTTTARALYRSLRAKRYPVVLRHYETAYLPGAYQQIRETQDPHARFLFQMCSLALLRLEIQTSLQGHICICDRYYYSAVNYYKLVTGTATVPECLYTFLPPPDLAVLLECDIETRRTRLASHSPSPRKLETLGQLGEVLLTSIRTQAEWYTIKNDMLSVSDCVGTLEEVLHAHSAITAIG